MRRAILAVTALATLAGCGQARPVRRTGGPATAPAVLKAHGYVVVPGTNVALRPPSGFVVDASLPGLLRSDGSSAFLVRQKRAPYGDPRQAVDDLAAELPAEAAATVTKRGLVLGPAQRFSIDGRPAVGWLGTQTRQGAEYQKAVVMFPSEGFLVTISASLAQGDPLSARRALAVLRAARWSAVAAKTGPGFSVTPATGYVKLAWGLGLAYSLHGDSSPHAAAFVSKETHDDPIPHAERRAAARGLFHALPGRPAAAAEQRVRIAGLPGWELRGSGRDDGREQRTYAAVLFTRDGWVALIGSYEPHRDADQTGAFRSMAHSLRLQAAS